MALKVANIEFDRRRFEKALAYYGNKGIAPQPSQLRIEENLVDGQGVYTFNLRKENLSPCEQNLRRNDLFLTLGLSIMLRVEDADKPGVLPLLSYAKKGRETVTPATANDPAVYTVDDFGFETGDIEALYNGKLNVTTQTTVNFEAMPTSLFKKESAGIVGTNANYVHDVNNGFDIESSIKAMAEELIFAGTQDHKITLSFPTFAGSKYNALQGGNGTSTADDTKIPNTKYVSKVVFFAFGYLIPGGTSDQYKNDPANPYAAAI